VIQTVSPIDSESGFKYELNTILCKYGTGFIERLLALWPEKDKMDKVLEHFTVLHTLRDANTHEILLVLAMVFAVSESSNQGSTYHIYKENIYHTIPHLPVLQTLDKYLKAQTLKYESYV
jgi:hypothetical protein